MSNKSLGIMIGIFLLAIALAGCGQKEPLTLTISSADSQPGNPNSLTERNKNAYVILQGETGYYYNAGPSLCLHYYDLATQKDILLCNKPECRHDGNEYCAATNRKYTPITFQFYDNAIFATAYCMDDERLEFKLLRFAPDGSSLTEIATYYSTSSKNIDEIPIYESIREGRWGFHYLLLHRNKAFLPFSYHPEDMAEGEYVYGLTELDLNTHEMKSVFDMVASKDNAPWYNLTARGDYLYYVQDETSYRHRLHRHSLLDDSDEILPLVKNFTGCYAVMDDQHVAYIRTDWGQIFVYDQTDGSNLSGSAYAEKQNPEAAQSNGWLTYVMTNARKRTLCSDGTYLYVIITTALASYQDFATGQVRYEGQERIYEIHVFDADMNRICQAFIPHPLVLLGRDPLEDDSPRYYYNFSLAFTGDQVFMTYKDDVFSDSMEDFLTGEPKFKHLYRRQK